MKSEENYSKNNFYNNLVKQACFIDSELGKILADNMHNSGFYELCKKFADIGFNAPKWRDGLNVQALFQVNDIEIAKLETIHFCKENNVHDIESFLSIVEVMHPFAVEDEDSRRHSGIVLNDDNTASVGLYGMYYNFQMLPEDIWVKLSDEIKSMWENL